ncbi:hypothetical protein GCM10027614_56860 [Micromonospora vulcania]
MIAAALSPPAVSVAGGSLARAPIIAVTAPPRCRRAGALGARNTPRRRVWLRTILPRTRQRGAKRHGPGRLTGRDRTPQSISGSSG